MSRGAFSAHVGVRLRPDVLGRVDALIPHFTSPLGVVATRADVLRHLVELGLRDIEEGRVKVDEVTPNTITPGKGRRSLHG